MKRIVITLAALFSLTGSCWAQSETHDGFFLRLAPGFGSSTTTEDTPFGEAEWSEASGVFSLMIGGAVVENLILHVDLASVVTEDPAVKINGQKMGNMDGTLGTSFFGVGVTYYLMPSNVYLSASIGSAKTEFESGGSTYSTDNGKGVKLSIGKEWWVSENWGLGIAGQYFYASCPDQPPLANEDVVTNSFAVLFSATFN